MSTYISDVDQLSVGDLYEMQVSDWRSRVPWFVESTADTMAIDRPKDGTYVVYLGKHPAVTEGMFYYRFLSHEGKMYRVYNIDFVYGLKETQHEVL